LTGSPGRAPTARDEWRTRWPLPFVAMLGISGSSLYSFSNGVFLGAVTREFGWSRADFSWGFTVQMLLVMLTAPFIGRLIDRFGPRRLALIGIVPFALGLSSLGLANGSLLQWVVLCAVQGLAGACISPVVWLTAIVGHFNASRGMALAIAQAGLGVSSAIWPSASAFYIQTVGWRYAFVALALTWMVPMLPLAVLFFRDARDHQSPLARARTVLPPPMDPPGVARLLFSRTFICLILAGGLFSTVSIGMTVQMVPLLQTSGFSLTTATSIASVAGVATLIGRLLTGLLLDRIPAKIVAIVTFLVPILPVLLLWQFKGSLEVSIAAMVIFGFTAGAESDVVAYIASRLLPPGVFASGYAIIIAVYAVFASVGPLVASRLFDVHGSYDIFLMAIVPTVIVCAGLIATLPPILSSNRVEPVALPQM